MLTAAEWAVIALSLRVSLVAVLATLPLAFAIAWLLARRQVPGLVLLDALVHLPLVLPPVVTGWLLLLAFGRNGPVGAWLEDTLGLTLVFNWTGAALAAAVMALPLMVRAMRLSIEAVDRRLVGAARTLGASRWRAFLTVTLPLSLPGIAAGAMLGFARSLGEFVRRTARCRSAGCAPACR
jgi:molybdate transport system permease protein